MVAFGVILYGFSIFVTTTAAGADFSKSVLSVAYGGSVLVGGLLAVPIGVWADRQGVRSILAIGGLLAGSGMWLFSVAQTPWHVVAAWWLFIGPGSAMLFYEVAFIALDQWCLPGDRPRALGLVTLIGGLAGIIFIPGTGWLVDLLEWRQAAAILGSLVALTALVAAAAVLGGLDTPRTSTPSTKRGELQRRLARDRRFTLHTAAMVLVFFAVQGLIAHRVAVFDEAGFDIGTVAAWAAAASALSLPGRWLAPLLATRFSSSNVQAATTVLLAAGTVLMLDGSAGWQMAGHFALFGLAFGAFLPLRAMTMSEWFSGSRYGATMGSQWTIVTIVGASGPVVTGLLRDATAEYTAAIAVLVAALAAAAVLLIFVARIPAPEPDATTAPTK